MTDLLTTMHATLGGAPPQQVWYLEARSDEFDDYVCELPDHNERGGYVRITIEYEDGTDEALNASVALVLNSIHGEEIAECYGTLSLEHALAMTGAPAVRTVSNGHT
jgi:hypothetical protein